MVQNMEYAKSRDLLLRSVRPVKTEAVPLEESAGRVLAGDWTAAENVPAFDRSPYDGYAFRAADSAGASNGAPVTLAVLEESGIFEEGYTLRPWDTSQLNGLPHTAAHNGEEIEY